MIIITCLKCNHKADVMHLHWEAISCLGCKEMIENPINKAIKQLQSGFIVDDEYGAEHIAISRTIQRSVIQLLNQLKEGGE